MSWIEKNFLIPETRRDPVLRGRMLLQPYQRDALTEALSTDAEGNYKYSVIVWSDIKKSAKCVSLNTRVVMGDGSLCRAAAIQVNDVVMAFNGTSFCPSRVANVEIQDPSPMYSVSTSRGRKIVVTGEHPFLVNGNDVYPSQTRLYKRSLKEPTWIAAKDLEIGSRIVVALGWLPDIDVPQDYLDEMYLLGAYIGDGGQGNITTADEEIRQAFANKFSLTKRGKYGYYLLDSPAWLRKWGLLNGVSCDHHNHLNSYTKRVPRQVFSSGRKAVAEFLSGYLDTDGTVANTNRKQPSLCWSSVNRDLLQDCQTLLTGLGINATLFRHDTLLNGEAFEAYTLALYGKEQVLKAIDILHPRVARKRGNFHAWVEKIRLLPSKKSNGISLYSSDKVVKIERLESQHSVAIEVENFHTHITEDLVSHNSTIAAAVNLYRAEFTEFGEFYIIANDLKQADSRVAHYIRRAIQLNPKFQKKYQRQGYKITAPSGSTIEAIPIDPSGEAGSNADQMTWSELWGANEEAKANMWAEMTNSPTKFGKSFRWIESYAGWAEQSELLYSLYDMGVKEGHLLWPDRLYDVTGGNPTPLELYVNESARMFCLWNTQPRCPWQTPEYYASEEKVLSPNQFQRIHRNQWVSSSDTFVPMEWWASCRREDADWPEVPKNYPHIIILDAAVSGDSFGMAMGCRHPDPKLHNHVLIRYARRWMPPPHGKIDYQGTEERPGPERELRRLISEYNVVEVGYDVFQLHDMATRLGREHLAWFRPFGQVGERLEADSDLRNLIRDRRIWHHGEPDLTEHIQNADAQEDKEDRKLRLVKRAEKMKIDLAVCTSMLCAELLRLNL